MEDFGEILHFWRMVIVHLTLLGVYLVLLGVAVAGLVTALKRREDEGWR